MCIWNANATFKYKFSRERKNAGKKGGHGYQEVEIYREKKVEETEQNEQ